MDAGIRGSAYAPVRFRVRPEVRRKVAMMNVSQNELARRCSVSSGYMSQLLTGERCAGPQIRARLLSALLTLQFDELFVETDHD